MAMSNADNPVADPVEEVTPDPAPKKPKAKEPAPLVKASTSGSADVHNLMAEWEIASSNQDADHAAAVEAKLAELGYRI
jgi:hypothetical protein